LANGIEWLFLHENKEAIQKEARGTILKRFAPDVVAAQHLELYQKLTTPK
jgi:hypothetical protein